MYWGCGAAAALSSRLMCSRRMLGPTTTSARRRWDFLLLAAYSSTAVATDLVPQHTYGLQLRCAAGDAAQLGMGELFESWRNWEQCFPERGFPAIFVDPRLFPRALRGDPGQLGVQLSLPERQTQQRWLRLCHPGLLLWWLLLGEGSPGSPSDTCHSRQRVSGLWF